MLLLLLLLSRFSRVRLCATPWTAAYLAPPSMGFSRQEYWSGVPVYYFPLFVCIDHWWRLSYLSLLFFGILHSDGYSFPFLLFASLLFSAICKASSDNHFVFLPFFFFGMVLITASYTMPWICVHRSSLYIHLICQSGSCRNWLYSEADSGLFQAQLSNSSPSGSQMWHHC